LISFRAFSLTHSIAAALPENYTAKNNSGAFLNLFKELGTLNLLRKEPLKDKEIVPMAGE
jgi:hypothetical protein